MRKYTNVPTHSLWEMLGFWKRERVARQQGDHQTIEMIDTIIIEIKKEIRRRNNKPASDTVVLWGEFDSWTELVTCPAWVKSAEDAEEFFNEELDLPPIHSLYDCTGRAFVSGHKVAQRCGKWVVYVHKGLDV